MRLVRSKPWRRAYLQSILVAITSALLLFTAVTAYVVFYANYIPSIGIEKPIFFNYVCATPPLEPARLY